jgi:HSP20 family protein
MSLIKWNKKDVFPSFSSLMDDFFTDDFNAGLATTSFFPQANVEETSNEFIIDLAIPGQDKENINVEVDHGMLTISSETEKSEEEKEKNFTRKEYSYSSFKRSFTMPENVDFEKIEANYEKGILRLTLPKLEVVVSDAKKIKVG